jgi:DNA-binding NarL/FixJ family response regulator
MTQIRVAVVDDQPVVREAFADFLDAAEDVTVVARAGDGAQIVAAATTTPIDVVVMDVRMPVMSGVEATRRLAALPEMPRVLILTTYGDDTYVRLAIAHGAQGFLLKDVDPDDLVSAVRTIARGGSVLSAEASDHLFSAFRPAGGRDARLRRLSPREAEILELIGAGLSNGEIADHLVVAESTVKTHVRALLSKLDCRDRVALVRMALGG